MKFYLERRRVELPTVLKVLQAIPADRLAYKPHDRSPAADIVRTLTAELRSCVEAATSTGPGSPEDEAGQEIGNCRNW